VLGPLLLVSVCLLSAHTHVLLVRCRREASTRAGYGKLEIGEAGANAALMDRHDGTATLLTYEELGQSVLGASGGRVVAGCLLCASIGVCSAYVVFITENVCSVVEGGCKSAGHRAMVTIPILVLLVLLSLLRDHRRLSFTSILGDVAIVGGTLIAASSALHVQASEHLLPDTLPLPWASPSTLPLSFGHVHASTATPRPPNPCFALATPAPLSDGRRAGGVPHKCAPIFWQASPRVSIALLRAGAHGSHVLLRA
jgi:hypothetical protein